MKPRFLSRFRNLSDELALSCAETVWRGREEKKWLVFAWKECYTSYHLDPQFTFVLDIAEDFSKKVTEDGSAQAYDQGYAATA